LITRDTPRRCSTKSSASGSKFKSTHRRRSAEFRGQSRSPRDATCNQLIDQEKNATPIAHRE
jgi:hypothetical protein